MKQFKPKKLQVNLIQFIIGIILIVIVGFYLTQNQAEKVSLVSGFKVVYQRLNVRYHNIFIKDGDILDGKYSLERSYQEFIKVAESGNCKGQIDAITLEKVSKQLENDTLEDYKKKIVEYNNYASSMYQQINQLCK